MTSRTAATRGLHTFVSCAASVFWALSLNPLRFVRTAGLGNARLANNYLAHLSPIESAPEFCLFTGSGNLRIHFGSWDSVSQMELTRRMSLKRLHKNSWQSVYPSRCDLPNI